MSDITQGLESLGQIAGVPGQAAQRQEPAPLREKKIDKLGRAYATGKRKNAVARVWVKPGKGKITVNGKDSDAYFARPVLRMLITQPFLVADQAVTVDSAISEFMESLWQAIAIILVVSFISLGVRPGLVIALAIPLTLAIVFVAMDFVSIDMQRISLGALIIALALLVDDAMTTTDAMLTRLGEGDDKMSAATFAYRTYAYAMLAGTFVTMAGFVPVGFAASSAPAWIALRPSGSLTGMARGELN